ncbi:hypothetical protein COCON_G00038470 [Conger conger]|uniref:Uncharacterized protein n=1 Tax=Conger conger TaxID=82655 RepID=A0A9Q1I629_CONCO|nr:hypothetical protein COCON_G00038470 [Conger conger]
MASALCAGTRTSSTPLLLHPLPPPAAIHRRRPEGSLITAIEQLTQAQTQPPVDTLLLFVHFKKKKKKKGFHQHQKIVIKSRPPASASAKHQHISHLVTK